MLSDVATGLAQALPRFARGASSPAGAGKPGPAPVRGSRGPHGKGHIDLRFEGLPRSPTLATAHNARPSWSSIRWRTPRT